MMDARNRCYQFDNVQIDVQNLRVTVDGETRPLEPKSFRLLLYLVEHPGRALTKDEIMAAVWPGAFVSDNSLARAITQIRKALDDDPKAPRYVETVPTVGYRFLADCTEQHEEEPGAAVVASRPSIAVGGWRRWWMLGVDLLCGDVDKGADWAEKAINEGDLVMRTVYIRFVACKQLRASSRWPKLARMVNLPAPGLS